MQPGYADGADVYREAYFRGLTPDPDLWVDEWADEYMRIPRDTGAAEPGQYRTSRTPYAREPMRCLSPAHPCKRVVTMVASQLMKTQIALNWIGGLIHMAPSNILTLLPSLGLAKRVSSRISKTIKATPVLRERVAATRSRDSRNTMDTKEFEGGSLYVTTAGSAANLAELSARYVYGDEVDRWEVDVGEEGDPIELAETRGSTFGRNAKFYFSSSPTIKGASRIADLFEASDQRYYFVPCPTCGHMQTLEWERLHYSADLTLAHYQCAGPDCDVLIEEHHKGEMLAKASGAPRPLATAKPWASTSTRCTRRPAGWTGGRWPSNSRKPKRRRPRAIWSRCRCSTTPGWQGSGTARRSKQRRMSSWPARGLSTIRWARCQPACS